MKHKCPMCSYYGNGEVYKFCKNCDSAREIGVTAGLERAAVIVTENTGKCMTDASCKALCDAIRKEKK